MSPDWRIYYADGSTYDGDVFKAPYKRVAFVLIRHPDVGRFFAYGADCYVWLRGEWLWCDKHDAFDHVNANPLEARGFYGQWMPAKEWAAIWERGLADPDFPVRSGQAADERVPR